MDPELLKSTEQEKEEARNVILELRDRYREHATELQKNVAEVQAAKHETVLYRLMSRTNNNPELINAINEFLNALDRRSAYGNETEPLGKESVEKLTTFFQERTKELDFLVGTQP